MKHLRRLYRGIQTQSTHTRLRFIVPALLFSCVAIILTATVTAGMSHRAPIASSETRFVEHSAEGLQIIPASCPSNPHFWGDCTQIFCPSGYIYDSSAGGCVIVPQSCPIGYTWSGFSCVFTGCPANYVLQGGTCVYVAPPVCTPSYSCQSGNLYYEDVSCHSSLVQTCSYGCSNNQCNPTPSPDVITWNVKPTLVRKGDTVMVNWEVNNVTSCTVTGTNGDAWNAPSGSNRSGAITQQTFYTLHCVAYPDAPIPWVDRTITVNIIPGFIEN